MYRLWKNRNIIFISMLLLLSFLDVYAKEKQNKPKSNGQIYKLDKNSVGYMEKIDNILNRIRLIKNLHFEKNYLF